MNSPPPRDIVVRLVSDLQEGKREEELPYWTDRLDQCAHPRVHDDAGEKERKDERASEGERANEAE